MPLVQHLKALLPPPLKAWLRRRLGLVSRFRGQYASWEEASAQCSGYGDSRIFERVLEAARQVRDGKACYEQDSVLFHQPNPNHRLLAHILRCALGRPSFTVVDFGGALGSSYWRHKNWLNQIHGLQWRVVEQEHLVRCGREEFADDRLSFHASAEDAFGPGPVDLLLCSSSLQFLEDPWRVLRVADKTGVRCLFIDRTPLLDGETDRICVQQVPRRIYPATYPARILSRKRLLEAADTRYVLNESWNCDDGDDLVAYGGFCLDRKTD